MMPTVRSMYVAALNELTGTVGDVRQFGPTDEVSIVSYSDMPEPGVSTLFTFGVSDANREEWIYGRPEFVLSLRTTSLEWVRCLGELVLYHRASSLFEYGTVLHFNRIIEPGCRMTSMLIFASNILTKEQQRIALPDRVINLAQLYPVYAEEAGLIRRVGVESFFFDLGIEFEDLRRPSSVEASA